MAAALIFVPGAMPSFDRNGSTCVAELYFYTNDGTYTPKSVYTASDLITPHTFPVVSDASGVFPDIWADSAQQFTVSWLTRETDPQSRTLKDVKSSSTIVQGLAGPSGSQQIGSVTTVSYGSGSSVSNVGTPEAAIWNIQLERGPPGTAGSGTGDMLRANNLSDVVSTSAALSNLGGLPKAGGTMTGPLTLAADAANALEPATKQQLDTGILAVGKRNRVRAATTANIAIATALNSGDVLDGVTLATGDLVLVKDQSSPVQNGIYVVGASPVRSPEYDAWGDFPGSMVVVAEGTTNADTLWLCTSNDGGSLGSTALTFSRLRIDIQIPVPASQGGTGLNSPGAAGNVLTSDGAGGWISASVASAAWDFIAQEERSTGVSAGNGTALDRVDRAFALAVKRNTLSLTTTSTSVTLTAGTWLVKAEAPFYGGLRGRAYLYNSSASQDIEAGGNVTTTTASGNSSFVEAVFTVVSDTEIKLQQYCLNGGTNGLGQALNAGTTEVYSRLLAKKIA